MKPNRTMRVARPTDNLTAIAEMYSKGLDLEKLSQFTDHDGFDGVILGHPGHPYHLEFTSQQEHKAGSAPSKDHLLVFYIPDEAEWEETCGRMLEAGFLEVSPYNPFWDIDGRTFEDLDGYRVVLQKIAWTK